MTPNYVGGTQSNRWLFTAEVMTAFLRDTVNAKAVDATRLPRAVHRDACEFFALALGRKSAEPPVSANAYGLAIEALQSPRVANDMRAAPEKLLSKLAAFNKHLATTRPLSEQDLPMASSLLGFFSHLKDESQASRF